MGNPSLSSVNVLYDCRRKTLSYEEKLRKALAIKKGKDIPI